MPPDSNELLAGSFRTPTDRVTVSQMLIEADGKRNADRLRNDAWGFHMADKRGLDFQHPTREILRAEAPSGDYRTIVGHDHGGPQAEPLFGARALRLDEGVQVDRAEFLGPDKWRRIEAEEWIAAKSGHDFAISRQCIWVDWRSIFGERREIFQLGRINTPAPSVTGRLLIYEQAASNDLTIAAGGKGFVDLFAIFRGDHAGNAIAPNNANTRARLVFFPSDDRRSIPGDLIGSPVARRAVGFGGG